MKKQFASMKRIVVKVGSALLVEPQTGTLNHSWLEDLCADIAKCRQQGQEIILVSSGAIALGKRVMTNSHKQLSLEEQQAAAAIGQIQLAHAYQSALAKHDITIAQILLTLDDSENRKRYINARNTLQTLLKNAIVPIINENDTVATNEIRYGDNDRLAARVAQMLGADALVLLSDIDGLYDADPHTTKNAQWIPEVTTINDEILAMANDKSNSQMGSGGMHTKILAAEIVMGSGCSMVILDGKESKPLSRLENGTRCTWFTSSLTPRKARKNWLSHHLRINGKLHIDPGATNALQAGKSMLAAGITSIEGSFQRGDALMIHDADGKEIARGLCNYNSREIEKIKGHKSQNIIQLLGYKGSDEVIHRDNLVLLSDTPEEK